MGGGETPDLVGPATASRARFDSSVSARRKAQPTVPARCYIDLAMRAMSIHLAATAAILGMLTACSTPPSDAESDSRGSAPLSVISTPPPYDPGPTHTTDATIAPGPTSMESRETSLEGLLCFDAPLDKLEPATCSGDSYILAGATTEFDWSWCSVAQGYPVKALSLASLDGVLCFLHLQPPTPVANADDFADLAGRCVAGGELRPRPVSCNEEYSVLITEVARSDAECPAPNFKGVLAWSVKTPSDLVVCVQRFVTKDPPSLARPTIVAPWSASFTPPPELMRPTIPFQVALERAPSSWSTPGTSYSVRCADGSVSHSGGKQGACSWHGGTS